MGILTSQQITRYYEQYREKEVTFSKEIVKVLKLDPRQVFIKCLDAQWPCIINSTSLVLAKIIIGINSGAYNHLVKDRGNANLRFHFVQGKGQPISFYVATKVVNVATFGDSTDFVLVTLSFTQRPPDDLIEIIGQFIEANVNYINRKNERIALTPDVKRKLGLSKEETTIQIQGVPRHCVLRDLSFGHARIILMGLKKFLIDKEALLRLEFEDIEAPIDLKGLITEVEPIQDRRDISVVTLQFDEKQTPMLYKLKVNSFIANVKRPQQLAPASGAAIPPVMENPAVLPAPAKDVQTEKPGAAAGIDAKQPQQVPAAPGAQKPAVAKEAHTEKPGK
jgi:hypothetical protein